MRIPSLLPIALRACLLGALFLGARGVAAAPNANAPDTAPAVAVDITVAGDAARTLFTIMLSKPVTAHAHLMERPDRVIVDLPEVTFHLPTETGRKKEGLVASFRYGLFAPGRSRVVMDLAQPAVVSRIEVVNGKNGAALLQIELARTEREEFRKAVSESAARAQGARPIALPAETADRRPVIMLDPGHGGIDPGANSNSGVYEKEIVFAYAQKLKKKLESAGRYRVLLTRDEDVFIPLGDRVRIARAAAADLFISIHADSISGSGEVRGLTVYTGSERASDADSARLADRENRADAAAGIEAADMADDISDILQDLTLRETRAFSHGFAARLVSELDTVARLNKNPHRQAGFRVLRAHDIPSVLLELGYLSSRKDFDLLMSDEWRELSTGAIATAIDRFFATRLADQGIAPVSP
jgi:N-acetylmuramoyl-L-alanine amidase